MSIQRAASVVARSARHPSARGLVGAQRSIVVGRDGRHWNPIILMVPQQEEWMIERFGRFSRTATPGLNFAIPFIETVAYKRSLKESAFPIKPQTAITKDNVHVQLDGAVYAKVDDAYRASYGIEDPASAITVLAQSAMRKEVGNLELDQLFLERDTLNSGIAQALDAASQPWGIRVFRYEIAECAPQTATRTQRVQPNASRV